ncbi:MAG: hypothetical protein M1540_00870 [Candidatus Bathyarchaeota archaeon]|nr:hypothetical protein [Candidatus Bathyarchaeota archaeon]
MTGIIACDSTNYERWKPSARFNALIGVAVQIDDISAFKSNYTKSIQSFFEKNGLQLKKKVYCSSELAGMFFDVLGLGHEEYKKALWELVNDICTDSNVTVFHASCNTQKYPHVNVFLEDATMGKMQPIPTMEFLRDWLSQYYVYISAWKLLKCLNVGGRHVLLDVFKGPISYAWNELVKNNKVEIVNLGDECNAYVSTADLVARLINEALGSLKISQENIEQLNINCKEFHVHYCFHNDLRSLVPIYEGGRCKTGRQINLPSYWRKPMVYILREGTDTIREDNEWLRKTPFYNIVCNFAFDVDGCVKFYDKNEDKAFISGDKLVFYGSKGKEKATEIKEITDGLGIDVEIFHSKDLSSVSK